MSSAWVCDAGGPPFDMLGEPVPLARRGMGLPRGPGLYVVTCSDCLAHVGTSSKLATRVGHLACLGMQSWIGGSAVRGILHGRAATGQVARGDCCRCRLWHGDASHVVTAKLGEPFVLVVIGTRGPWSAPM